MPSDNRTSRSEGASCKSHVTPVLNILAAVVLASSSLAADMYDDAVLDLRPSMGVSTCSHAITRTQTGLSLFTYTCVSIHRPANGL